MKAIFLPLLCAALLGGLTACNDGQGNRPDVTNTADNNADDNAMSNATKGNVSAAEDGDTTGQSGGLNPEHRTGPYGLNGSVDTSEETMPHGTDQEFLMSIAHSNQNEIMLSRIALEKGATGVAKQYATMMVGDHNASGKQLQALAQKKNVTLPTDMDAAHKPIAEQMGQLSGKQLEQRYLQQMAADHQKTFNTMQAHLRMVKDGEVRAFIAEASPMIQKHLELVREYAGIVK